MKEVAEVLIATAQFSNLQFFNHLQSANIIKAIYLTAENVGVGICRSHFSDLMAGNCYEICFHRRFRLPQRAIRTHTYSICWETRNELLKYTKIRQRDYIVVMLIENNNKHTHIPNIF